MSGAKCEVRSAKTEERTPVDPSLSTLRSSPISRLPSLLWDAVVIGAGPAGAMAARQLARRGMKVLLVDKARFPRDKVCGCCVNRAAIATLESVGLGSLLGDLGAVVTSRFRLYTARRCVSLPVHGGVTLVRAILDDALAASAVQAGAVFLDGVSAALGDIHGTYRDVRLTGDTPRSQVRARVVLLADGLSGADGSARVAPANRIGVAAIGSDVEERVAAGVIHMAYHRRGYVGMVRLEDGRLNLAAALDPSFSRESGRLGAAVRRVLDEVHMPVPDDLETLTWRGTPYLTRRHRVLGGERFLRLGDAAGYVEPFTGEGIAWALLSGKAVAPFAAAAVREWDERTVRRWTNEHRRLIGRRQRLCRVMRRALRHPWLVEAAAAALAAAPKLAEPVMQHLNRPPAAKRGGAYGWA